MTRASGVLLHPTSFPNRTGIGDFGASAFAFIDFLAQAKQKIWQTLPLGPTSFGDSPYQCLSSMAGNTLLISLEALQEQGYLPPDALDAVPAFPTGQVDFCAVIPWKTALLAQASQSFRSQSSPEQRAAYIQFCSDNAYWLEDYAQYCALKDAHGGRCWVEWEPALRAREPGALSRWAAAHQQELAQHRFLQYEFYRQWGKLRAYANGKGVQVMGDIPIFIAFDSADTWANQALFELDAAGQPTVVAGVPPDYFSATGQRWGNPLYRWDVMAADGYTWWKKRFQALLAQVDIIRIDHFRGFEAYWEIPASEPTAVHGRWVKGPGLPFFQSIREAFGAVPIVAEDLGLITPEVDALRDGAGFPGMRIFQFGFTEDNPLFLAKNYIPNCVAYTGTHDNNTTRGWFQAMPEGEKEGLFRYFGRELGEEEVTPLMVAALWESQADTVLVPLQDVLNLGQECRMNFPGSTVGNWAWRYEAGALEAGRAEWLAGLTEGAGR